jgi:DNA invertase Pin-like site-specific DNA recombinase
MDAMKKNPKRIALYARVSTRDKGQDPKNQLNDLHAFAATQGWKITHEYIDHVTGKHSDREQFQRLFKDASQRKFDLVLFWSLDRFSREGALATMKHLERLIGWGVDWRSYTEQYLDSCGVFRDGVLSILACIAKQEHIRISERTIAGLERARKQGRIGGRPPVPIDPRTIGEIATLRRQGISFSQIAQRMKINRSTLVKHWYQSQARKRGKAA